MSENRDLAQVFRKKNFTVIDLSGLCVSRDRENCGGQEVVARPEGFEPESSI